MQAVGPTPVAGRLRDASDCCSIASPDAEVPLRPAFITCHVNYVCTITISVEISEYCLEYTKTIIVISNDINKYESVRMYNIVFVYLLYSDTDCIIPTCSNCS